jgi:hypothetical protein
VAAAGARFDVGRVWVNGFKEQKNMKQIPIKVKVSKRVKTFRLRTRVKAGAFVGLTLSGGAGGGQAD